MDKKPCIFRILATIVAIAATAYVIYTFHEEIHEGFCCIVEKLKKLIDKVKFKTNGEYEDFADVDE